MDPSVEDIDRSLKLWSDRQVLVADKQATLAKALGRAMVTKPPHWETMEQDTTSRWWDDLMQGKNWYAIDNNSVDMTAVFETSKKITPMMDAEISNLCNDLAKSHLEKINKLPSTSSSAPRFNK